MGICECHHQFARAFTTGTGIGKCDFAQAAGILLWGHNPSISPIAAATRVAEARARGAKLIGVDPRHIGFAVKVRPGTEVAVALTISGVMIDEGWFDIDLVRQW